jgi:HEAT repeat protein
VKENFDAYCKIGPVGMPPALAILKSDLKSADQAAMLLYLTPLVQTLAECGDASLVPQLTEMLSAPVELEREAGSYILRTFAQRKISIRKATEPLLANLTDEQERTARNAAQALYLQGDPAILGRIVPLLSHERQQTRALAGELVEGLTGRDPGFQADAPKPQREEAIERIKQLLAERGLLSKSIQTQSRPVSLNPPIELSGTN